MTKFVMEVEIDTHDSSIWIFHDGEKIVRYWTGTADPEEVCHLLDCGAQLIGRRIFKQEPPESEDENDG